jgi:hypothetical protein
MDGNGLLIGNPDRLFGLTHLALSLFCKRRECVPVLIHNLVSYFHGPLEVGVIWKGLKPTSREFSDVQFLTALEVEPLHQFPRK